MPPCLLEHKSGIHYVFPFHPSTCCIQSYDNLSCCVTHSSHDLANAVEMLTKCRRDRESHIGGKCFPSRPIHFVSAEARQIAHPKLSALVEIMSTCCGGKGVMFRLRP